MVLIEGFGRYRNYYRDALDKVGVTVNLMKVGTYKSFAEPFIGNGPSRGGDRAGRRPVQRAVGQLHRPASRRTASCRPAPSTRPSTACRELMAAGRRQCRQAGAADQAGRRPQDPRRSARDDDQARRARPREQDLPPGVVQRLPGAPASQAVRRRRRRDRRFRRHHRRQRQPGRDRRHVHRQPDPPRARGRPDQGRRAARRFAGRQRLRLGADPARAGTDARRRQAGGGVDGQRGRIGRLLDFDGGRRSDRRPDHDHRLDRRVRDPADRREGGRQAGHPHRRRHAPPGWPTPTTRCARSTRASASWSRAASTTSTASSPPRRRWRARPRRPRSTKSGRAGSGPARRRKERGLVDRWAATATRITSAAQRAKLGDDYRVAYIEQDELALRALAGACSAPRPRRRSTSRSSWA